MSADASSCAVIDFSVFLFTDKVMLSEVPYGLNSIDKVKKFKLSVKEQVKSYKYGVSDDTRQFWSKQPAAAKALIQPKPDDLTLEQFGAQFFEYLETREETKLSYWWSRSNTFDPIILSRILTDLGLIEKFNRIAPHWKLRDTRSFIDGALGFPKKNGFVPMEDEAKWKENFVEHDSAWDVLADVLRIQGIIRSQKGLAI